MVSMDEYFSILALFILFRETIEASIICGVLLQFLNRAKPRLKRIVWWGVAGGVGVSILFGIIFIVLFYVAKENLFQGKNRDWFKGIIAWIAATLITFLGFAMLRFLGWEEKWKRKLLAAMAKKAPVVPGVDKEAAEAAAASSEPTPGGILGVGPAESTYEKLPDGANSRHGSDDASLPWFERCKRKMCCRAPAAADTAPALTAPPAAPKAGKDAAGSDVDTNRDSSEGPASAAHSPTAPAAAAAVENLLEANRDLEVAPDGKVVELDPVTGEAMPTCDMSEPNRKEKLSIWVLVFTTVVREGIESVVFLGGLGNVKLSAIPLAAFVGIVSGILVGVFLFYSGRQVKDLKWLIIAMAILIFFLAAGQVSLGTDALYKAGLFGYCSPWYDERPWYMLPLYDWSVCCGDLDPKGHEPTDVQNRMRFFALARAIFGYQDKGTPLEIIFYVGYWGLILIISGIKLWHGTLFDADYKYHREQRRLRKEAARKAEADAAAENNTLEKLEHGETASGPAALKEAFSSSSVGAELAPEAKRSWWQRVVPRRKHSMPAMTS